MSGRTKAARYVLAIRINAVEWKLPVCEMTGGAFDCRVIGQDLLGDVIVRLDGPAKRLEISK